MPQWRPDDDNDRSYSAHTHVKQLHIDDPAQAVTIFAQRNSDGTTPLVLVPSRRFSCSYFLTIPSGVYVLMQKWGAHMDSLEPGLQMLPPWYRIAYIVTRQSCTYNAPVKDCPTSDNVRVQVDITFIFHIDDPKKFVYTLGAQRFDELLSAAAEEACRGLVRRTKHSKVYELRGNRADDMLALLDDKFKDYGVKFTDTKITGVWLPQDVSQALKAATVFDSKMKEHLKQHEYTMSKTENEATLSMEELKRTNNRSEAEAIAEKERAKITIKEKIISAEKKKETNIVKAQQALAVARFEAQAKLDRAKMEGEKVQAELILEAEASAKEISIDAERKAEVMVTQAQASLAAAKNEAAATLAYADAEEKAAPRLKEERKHKVEVAKMESAHEIAQNGRIVMSGASGDKLISNFL